MGPFWMLATPAGGGAIWKSKQTGLEKGRGRGRPESSRQISEQELGDQRPSHRPAYSNWSAGYESRQRRRISVGSLQRRE